MRFAYYDDLSPAQKKVYRASDAIAEVPLPRPRPLQPLAAALERALAKDDVARVTAAAQRLAAGITTALAAPPVEIEVLAVRPRWDTAELHGLYTQETGRTARIQIWMRTAHHRRVVAFRTLLRTLLHELCHHLDLHHFQLKESLHTEGFFKRESSLFHQLVPQVARAAKTKTASKVKNERDEMRSARAAKKRPGSRA